FHEQPTPAKLDCAFSADFSGYIPSAAHVIRTSQVNTNTKGDLNEAYFIEREAPPNGYQGELADEFVSPNQWPKLPEFRTITLDYFNAMEGFARSLLPLYAAALKLDIDWFEEAFRWPQASLRLSHYPVSEREDNQFGIAPHTDAGFLTVLPQSDVTGLHIRVAGEDWIEAPRVHEGLFVNSGDMLKRWTNDQFLSTQHMAVNEAERDRYAAVFFFSPTLDYEMSCLPTCQSAARPPRYDPITYGQYRAWFMDSNYRPEAPARAQATPVAISRKVP
ncbi:MAG: isopenicillin N synthase family oxygenase, partial [Chromatiales bacterium]|nr:isopenicillin N synthase family oxygenase [Chromatiales bacterium]